MVLTVNRREETGNGLKLKRMKNWEGGCDFLEETNEKKQNKQGRQLLQFKAEQNENYVLKIKCLQELQEDLQLLII